MKLSKKQFSLIIIGIVALLCVWFVNVKLKDHKSFLFQLREFAFPAKYSQGQGQNFQADLSYAAKQVRHENIGWDYAKAGDYDKAIAEFQIAIELTQDDPRGEVIRIDNQKFPRGRLMKVYEKAGRFKEAIEQIDWLLAHSPSEPHRLDLLAWKDVFTAESAGEYEKALEHIDAFLKSADELKEYRKKVRGYVQPEFVLEEFRAKREKIQRKLRSELTT